ncbi:MAG: amino acid dehydrogenase [Alphaproteobacteria bacterium]|nr:amino acid dehydrogenase [Alphaproteobacteria bacterium]
MFDLEAFDDHREVVHVCRPEVGLRAIVALHDTTLGPGLGGCRMWAYTDARAATVDALRLSRGMTFKNALAGLPFGGGKSVILGDPARDKTPALLEAFAAAVEELGGRYVVAEDVGITEDDARVFARRTRHVCGVAAGDEGGDDGGDPAPKTARGLFKGLEAAVSHVFGRDDLDGLRVAVQGLGAVGWKLSAQLHAAGARLVVADLDAERVERARAAFAAEIAPAEAIHRAEVDVFAPCALGGVLDRRTIPELRCRLVAGAANNQLATDADGDALAARGITYVPDYVINAGGVIAVAHEYLGERAAGVVRAKIDRIAATVSEILEQAQADGTTPARAADAAARRRLGRRGERRRAA